MKRIIALTLTVFMFLLSFCGCAKEAKTNETVAQTRTSFSFADDLERERSFDGDITRVVPSGAVAQMILTGLCPDLLIGLSGEIKEDVSKYYPEDLKSLPAFGQFYGKKANFNLEAFVSVSPELVIDIGDKKGSIEEDLNALEEQTGVTTLFFSGELNDLSSTYRKLGELLGKKEKAEKIATYIDDSINLAKENSAKIKEEDKKSVYFGIGADGLSCNASGSTQADVIDLIGAKNAIVVDKENISNKSGGTLVDLELIYSVEPDVYIFNTGSMYDSIKDSDWKDLKGIQNDAYYEVPALPYPWMSEPPSVNRILGIYWLGNLIYSDVYNFDIKEKVKEYYELFYDYSLSDEEVNEFLAHSTLKK